MPKSAHHHRNATRKKKSKTQKWGWIGWVIAFLLVGFVLFQGIQGLLKPSQAFGENYYCQPVGPGLQLVVGGIFLMIMIYVLIRKERFSKKDKKSKIFKRPFIPGKVPDRWPWQ